MAETPVLLAVDGFAKREVQSYSYSFNQSIDKENQPAGIPRGGLIKVTVKAQNDGNIELLGWMLDPDMKKDGAIIIMKANDIKNEMKQITFKKAYCVDYKEDWADASKNVDIAHTETIIISCQEIKIGNVDYKNAWK
ncbi:MAG: hypothetical protein FWF70_08260 [Bacteroidetes bacterium]|nr:hypothetical protein [Bacteroidota bacterium]MCL1968245.1 hypothetical protein [Bacteroidota bacterium]